MATFVLVHGGWAGGWVWKFITPLLRAAAHEVYTPTLTGLGERVHLAHPDIDLALHIQDVVNVFRYEDLQDVVLVGWSLGGMIITGVAEQIPERLAHLVYLDALCPHDQQSAYDLLGPAWQATADAEVQTFGDGWRRPPPKEERFYTSIPDATLRMWFVSRLTFQPNKVARQQLQRANPLAAHVPRTHIACIAGWSDRFPCSHASGAE